MGGWGDPRPPSASTLPRGLQYPGKGQSRAPVVRERAAAATSAYDRTAAEAIAAECRSGTRMVVMVAPDWLGPGEGSTEFAGRNMAEIVTQAPREQRVASRVVELGLRSMRPTIP